MIQIKPCKDTTETGTPITYFNHDSEVTHRNQLPINKPIRDLRNLLYIFWVNLKEINPILSTHYQVNVKYSHLHELLLRAFPYRPEMVALFAISFLPFRGQKRMPL